MSVIIISVCTTSTEVFLTKGVKNKNCAATFYAIGTKICCCFEDICSQNN